MKSEFQIEKPEDVNLTLKITLTLGEWISLKNQLSPGFPAWKMKDVINNLVQQAKTKFYPTIEDKEKECSDGQKNTKPQPGAFSE